MFDDPDKEIAAAKKVIDEVTTRDDIPSDVKRSLIGKIKRRLKALDGDVNTVIELSMETGLRYEDAVCEATDYIWEHRPRGDFHAAKTVLKRTPGSPYYRIPSEEPGP